MAVDILSYIEQVPVVTALYTRYPMTFVLSEMLPETIVAAVAANTNSKNIMG